MSQITCNVVHMFQNDSYFVCFVCLQVCVHMQRLLLTKSRKSSFHTCPSNPIARSFQNHTECCSHLSKRLVSLVFRLLTDMYPYATLFQQNLANPLSIHVPQILLPVMSKIIVMLFTCLKTICIPSVSLAYRYVSICNACFNQISQILFP